jgi:uncharacterized protein with PIN domain
MLVLVNGIMIKDASTNQLEEAFALDGMLGRLAKWLRILGFDTEYPCKRPAEDRYFVTANKKTRYPRAIIVQKHEPARQLQEVLAAARIAPRADLFLSRCLICNTLLNEVSRERVRERVPISVSEKLSSFRECESCGRVYWDGSHAERIRARLQNSEIAF